eukprot:5235724-Amphidinium_carterae.1
MGCAPFHPKTARAYQLLETTDVVVEVLTIEAVLKRGIVIRLGFATPSDVGLETQSHQAFQPSME